MKRATRNPAKTKQEIIEKSAPVFNIHGYSGTKMEMLVGATGYKMGGIYRHFETKMDLAKAVFRYSYETQVKQNLNIKESLHPKEKLLTILKNYKKMVIRPRVAGGCPLLNTAIEVDDTDEEFRKLALSFVEEVISIIAQILEEGKATGSVNPSIHPQKEAQFLFASFEGAIMLGAISKNEKAIFNVFERAQAYLEDRVFL